MKTKRSIGRGFIAAIMLAALSVCWLPSAARAGERVTAALSAGRAAGPARPSMTDTYGAREASAKDLARFEGGHRGVIVASSTLVIVLLVILIVIVV
jgi:hypothetical protein